MATPLASLFLIFAAASAIVRAEAPPAAELPPPALSARCPIHAWDPKLNTVVSPGADAKDCRDILSIQGPFKNLRNRAGFSDETLILMLKQDGTDNATFVPGQPLGVVLVNTGYFGRQGRARASHLYMLAHEIGHALQWDRPEGAERRRRVETLQKKHPMVRDYSLLPGPDGQEWLAFSRRYEAQADGIAQQLLVEAGYPTETNRVGHENFYGCNNPSAAVTHPAAKQRLVNAAFGQELIARHAMAEETRASVFELPA